MKAFQLLKIKKAPQMLPKIIKLRLISRKIIETYPKLLIISQKPLNFQINKMAQNPQMSRK